LNRPTKAHVLQVYGELPPRRTPVTIFPKDPKKFSPILYPQYLWQRIRDLEFQEIPEAKQSKVVTTNGKKLPRMI